MHDAGMQVPRIGELQVVTLSSSGLPAPGAMSSVQRAICDASGLIVHVVTSDHDHW